ncbi:family 16 glycoside hydrolase [Croceitalea rosinachiae]|uniref:Family 16 glycoside hydrolase n=1 Tax=Croceitalea rosinachiae TaxID=3075596 RepID=A0ABU3A763_9FLAO|nr:family 16 glycoside hydrolase [Croceitalea sp. F388]MDT0606023.1 family 16 glycoside hydrolase [Croceitalea sp. F388]
MTKILYSIIAIFSFQIVFGQDSLVKIDMLDSNWIIPENAIFENFDNKKTLLLKGKRATVRNLQFTNGTIEVDIYANFARSFAGITFRKQNDDMEEVYMRMHKSAQVDAIQYTPIFNNESNWQLYREYQAQVTFKNKGWNTLRIEVNNKSVEVFVNNQKTMTIDNLRTGHHTGEIGLFALFSNRFSNFRVTPKDVVDKTGSDPDTLSDPSIIKKWEITKANPYKAEELDFEKFSNEKFMTVETEISGLLPISKYVKKTSSGNFEQNTDDFIVASTTIHTNEEETKLFSFDYSDKIIVYLNGKIYFEGNNSFRAKGMQYTGHMGINTNKLYLPLKKGINRIHCVVIDKANGWGLMAKLESYVLQR